MKTKSTKPMRRSMFAFAFPTPLPAPCPPLTFLFSLFCFLLSLSSASATTRYVWQGSPSPAPPYTSWATAATNIQDAVDTAQTGDEVVVTNGTYATGGRAVGTNVLVNRVAVDKPLTLRSVNGPQFTVIQGWQVPGIINGDGAIRCVYLTNGASLTGFTLTNGATRVLDDYFQDYESSGGGLWCESTNAVASNCVVTGNSACWFGSGAYGGTLNNCVLIGNWAGGWGGGASRGTLNQCVLTGNSATFQGGGAYSGTLNNCTLTGNSADHGGGAAYSTLNNCLLTGNSAIEGGGAYGGRLNNCTVTGNSASHSGGGVYGLFGGPFQPPSLANNCIVYFNSAGASGANYDMAFPSALRMNYCDTTPLPASGTGNISLDPQLASPSHLSGSSPCRGAGSGAYATGTDIDGQAWRVPPSIGCDEYQAGAVTGPLSVRIAAAPTNVAVDYPVGLTALIEGWTTASVWDFGDGVVVSNRPYASHAWTAPGDYAVVLRAYNETLPAVVSATATVHVVVQPVHYAAANSANPVPPYTSWATAARNIQDAVDAATVPGALVLVTNGIYATGGRPVFSTMTNRVAVNKPLTLRSVNGPQNTVIQGYQVPGTTNGDGAIRCVYLADGASLSGFTLTHGATLRWTGSERLESGGGVWCESQNPVVSNCVVMGNSADGAGGGTFRGTLKNCSVTGNEGAGGGGAYQGVLQNCTLTANRAQGEGGGALASTLQNCALTANWAAANGGGATYCTLNNCTLTGNNSAYSGGGACAGTLNNCTLTANSAGYEGGGASGVAAAGTLVALNNCTLTDNSAHWGGGTSLGTLNNCTLTGNLANVGGGADGSTLNNCIVYFNRAVQGPNYSAGTLNFCCTTPLPSGGDGNISLDPQLASTSHLSAASPCRGTGSASYVTGTDIDGELWANPPSIGCDEYHAGSVTGPLNVGIAAAFTNVTAGYPAEFEALIDGRTTASRWEFGDGVMASNRPSATHAWTAAGDYAVVLRAYNESQPTGLSATVTVHVVIQPVHYVEARSINPLPPYTSWSTAATTIQDAVEAATAAGALVLVSNGVYATGGRAVVGTMTNRVTVDKPLILCSVNGPQFTVIQGRQVPGVTNGDGAVRCVYLADGASLSGFTLANGATRSGGAGRETTGGGLWCELGGVVVSNCVLAGNSAYWDGGGTFRGTLINCTLTANLAGDSGGGAFAGALDDCTLTGNSAREGAGAGWGTLNNCTLTGNSASVRGGGAAWGMLNNCTLTANRAQGEGGGTGGGAFASTLQNCTLSANSAAYSGGGASGGTLNNCTLTGNQANGADGGGGAFQSTLNNCIVYFNTATNGANYSGDEWWPIALNYCCTEPNPESWQGIGNITNAPLFVDYPGGNLRLQSNSPCINAGRNAYAPGPMDLDGLPRIVSGTVDIAAYEFQGPGSVISYAWLQRYGLPTDGSADATDPDADGHNTWQEWRCLTDPTNALSVLCLLSATPAGTNVTVSWQSVAGVNYFLERCTNVAGPPPIFAPLAPNLPGQLGTTSFTDTNAARLTPLFYRVAVGN